MLEICKFKTNGHVVYKWAGLGYLIGPFPSALIGANFDAVALKGPALTVSLYRLHHKNSGFGGN